jgi:hypothetical protein
MAFWGGAQFRMEPAVDRDYRLGQDSDVANDLFGQFLNFDGDGDPDTPIDNGRTGNPDPFYMNPTAMLTASSVSSQDEIDLFATSAASHGVDAVSLCQILTCIALKTYPFARREKIILLFYVHRRPRRLIMLESRRNLSKQYLLLYAGRLTLWGGRTENSRSSSLLREQPLLHLKILPWPSNLALNECFSRLIATWVASHMKAHRQWHMIPTQQPLLTATAMPRLLSSRGDILLQIYSTSIRAAWTLRHYMVLLDASRASSSCIRGLQAWWRPRLPSILPHKCRSSNKASGSTHWRLPQRQSHGAAQTM